MRELLQTESPLSQTGDKRELEVERDTRDRVRCRVRCRVRRWVRCRVKRWVRCRARLYSLLLIGYLTLCPHIEWGAEWGTERLIEWGGARCIAAPKQTPNSDLSSSLSSSKAHPVKAHPRILSGSLSLHFELPELGHTYERALDDAHALGLTHITLVAQATLDHVKSSEVRTDTAQSTNIATVERVAELARERGLKVIIFPILWVMRRDAGEWRGVITPSDLERWWSSYESYISAFADLAERQGATHLSIGSELSSMERYEGRWRALTRRLRARFHGALTYSANWDHYDLVGFWDALDLVGVTGYYPLATSAERPSMAYMTQRWRWVRLKFIEWLSQLKPSRSLFITELGYPSQRGGALKPWHYYQSNEVDLLVQRDAFNAFTAAWESDVDSLAGVSIWNLWGGGGPQDTWYSIKGKPAFDAVRSLIKRLKR